MSNKKWFSIAVLREVYGPDIQGHGAVDFLRSQDGRDDVEAFALEEARDMVGELDDEVYVTSNGESGRPEYVVVSYDDACWISEGRNSDMGNYDWEGADCDCGDCRNCTKMMINQDRDYVLRNKI